MSSLWYYIWKHYLAFNSWPNTTASRVNGNIYRFNCSRTAKGIFSVCFWYILIPCHSMLFFHVRLSYFYWQVSWGEDPWCWTIKMGNMGVLWLPCCAVQKPGLRWFLFPSKQLQKHILLTPLASAKAKLELPHFIFCLLYYYSIFQTHKTDSL